MAIGQLRRSKEHLSAGSPVTVGVGQILVHVPSGQLLTVTVAVGATCGIAEITLGVDENDISSLHVPW